MSGSADGGAAVGCSRYFGVKTPPFPAMFAFEWQQQ